MAFEMKPLEILDFSGGMTDNFLTAGPTHYQYADNFWLTTDKHLFERYGTSVLDPIAFNLGGLVQRVGGLFTMIDESILLAQSGRNIYSYVQNSGFNRIGSYTGFDTLGAGDAYSSVIGAEWHRHMYFASDAQAIPTKIYRDQNNVFQARTVGLPRATGVVNQTNDQILAKAITLANAIRTSMISHIQDTTLHTLVDTVALNYFIAQTFPPGHEQPPAGVTPLGPCIDLPSLLALIGNLNAAYEHQRADASLNGSRVYHMNIFSYSSNFTLPIGPTGMHVRVQNAATPTQLLVAAASIDDLSQKWKWHQLGVWVHSSENDYGVLQQYAVTVPKVGYISDGSPVLTQNLTDAFNFVNNCKFMWNSHITDGDGYTQNPIKFQHKTPDATISNEPWRINIPDCTDYDTWANLIFHLRCLYSLHYNDMVFSPNLAVGYTPTTTGGSAYTAMTYTNYSGVPALLPTPGLNAIPQTAWLSTLVPVNPMYSGTLANFHVADTYTVSGFNAGNINRYLFASGGTVYSMGQINYSLYHVARSSTGAFIDTGPSFPGPSTSALSPFTPASSSQITSQIDSVGVDESAWLALATEFFYCLAAHSTDGTAHLYYQIIEGNITDANYPTKASILKYGNPYLPFFVPTVASYAYAFVFTSTYTVEPNGLEYEVISNPIYTGPVVSSTIIPPNATIVSQFINVYPNVTYVKTQPVTITNLPSIVNTTNTSYDTSFPAAVNNPTLTDPTSTTGMTLDIYRTSDGGTTYFKVVSLQNGTTTYVDQTADSASSPGFPQLNLQQILYTSGGIVGNDQPPQAACITQLNGYMYYGNIISEGQAFPNRVVQSLPDAPDSAPATFFDDFDDAITGLSATRSVVVAFCTKSIYRMTGQFNELGQGFLTHEKISEKIGCVSAKSIVQTEIGLFFAGTDGFYYTDGYQLIKLTIELNPRYAGLTQTPQQQKRISGSYDRFNRRVNWSVQQNPTDTNQDAIWVFYLDYGVKPAGVFSVINNGSYIRPASTIVFNQQLVYGHELGYIFKFDPLQKSDPIINTATDPSTWQVQYIPYYYASAALDFGSIYTRKWNTKVHYLGYNIGNAAIQLASIRDNNAGTEENMAVLNYTQNPVWGQPNPIWGAPSSQQPYNWEYDKDVDAWRRFPAGTLRCDVRQMIVKPAFLAVYRSEDWPNFCFASVNAATKVITIATPSGYSNITWPLDIVNMQFAFNTDGYVQMWTILSVSGNTATVSDPGNTLTNASGLSWVIRGYKKNQRVSLTGMIVYYDTLGDKNSQYLGASSAGENT